MSGFSAHKMQPAESASEQASALPSPVPSNTVSSMHAPVCGSKRISASSSSPDFRCITPYVEAQLHRAGELGRVARTKQAVRAPPDACGRNHEDAVAEAYAMVFLSVGLRPANGCGASVWPVGAHCATLSKALCAGGGGARSRGG